MLNFRNGGVGVVSREGVGDDVRLGAETLVSVCRFRDF